MAATEAASKMPVLPRMIEMVVGIVTTRFVPDPPIVVVDVGGIWMFRLVAMALRVYPPWSLSGTVRRNVSSANGMGAAACLAAATAMTAAAGATLFAATVPRVDKSRNPT
jgi:hypothetical protein